MSGSETGGSEHALTHVRRAQEYRKRRKWRSLKQELDAAERLLERELHTDDPEIRTDGGDDDNEYRCPECGGTDVEFGRGEYTDSVFCRDCAEIVEEWDHPPLRTGEGDYRTYADKARRF